MIISKLKSISRRTQRLFTQAPACALVLILGCFSTGANAMPIAIDLDASGDGLLTIDGVTNLQWLDVTATQGLSYDEVTAGFGDSAKIQYGFRYATRQEFEAFSINVGLPFINGGNYLQNKVPASVIVDLLGITQQTVHAQGDTFTSWGLIDNDNPLFNPINVSRAFFSYTDRFNTGSSGTGNGVFTSDANANTGSFLVRSTPTSVPGPLSIVLFVFGLICTLTFRARR